MSNQNIYFFGAGKAEATKDMKEIVGGKGANLAEMTSIGIPVPPGFTISTHVCAYYSQNKTYPSTLKTRLQQYQKLKTLWQKFGSSIIPFSLRPFGSCRIHAGYDGHRP
jgi:pyruvate,orthophosphate dikinase